MRSGSKKSSSAYQSESFRDIVGTRVSDVPVEEVEWLWQGRLAIGKITILDGDPGVGKSSLTCEIASTVTTGGPWPDGSPCQQSGGVAFITQEDEIGDTIRPRLEAAGADIESCIVVRERFEIPTDLERLDTLVRTESIRLLVIDPLVAFLQQGKNSNHDSDMRQVLDPLTKWASERRISVLLIRHLNKKSEQSGIYRGGGSIGIIGAARFGLLLARDPSNEDIRVLAVNKCNIGRYAPSLEFEIVEHPRIKNAGQLDWIGISERSANQLVGLAGNRTTRPRERAKQWLAKELAAGPMAALLVKEAAIQKGISPSTLDRAKKELGIGSRMVNMKGEGQQWEWYIPNQDSHDGMHE